MNYRTKPTAEQRRNASVAASDVDDEVFILWGIPKFFSSSVLVELLVATVGNTNAVCSLLFKATGVQ